ncbi:hypothetical protein BT69DRAFT_1337528, partial [Atractiella rhizophila]
TKQKLEIREADLQKVQDGLKSIENESKKLGATHSEARLSLELELERLKGDLSRCEAELRKVQAELDVKDRDLREKSVSVSTLTSENRDLSSQLATQTQTRLSLTDKLDETTKSLRDAQTELAVAKERASALEHQLAADTKNLTKAEHQYRDQLTERNTLLLTVYQYLDKIAGSEWTPRKPGQQEAKPYSNFDVFQDNLMNRMKGIGNLRTTFEKRAKELETKFFDQFMSLKKQQEARLRQLDRFENSIKTATDMQKQWRQRLQAKSAELEAVRGTNTELNHQITSLKSRVSSGTEPGSGAKISALQAKASTAERKLNQTQNQLSMAEEKLEDARIKVSVAEGKWEARLKELEGRLKAAEEKVKRERQGAKERVSELNETIRGLEKQVQQAEGRRDRLSNVLDNAKKSPSQTTVKGVSSKTGEE